MRRSSLQALVCLTLAALTTAACSSSTPPPASPDDQASKSDETAAGATPEPQSSVDEGSSRAAPSGASKRPQGEDNSIPDDYTMMSGDCSLLGEKLGSVVRNEHMAQLSPKLSEDRRAAAEKNIDDVATKLSTGWINGCEKSLVGKVVDRAALKCALDARTMKAFEECINPPLDKK